MGFTERLLFSKFYIFFFIFSSLHLSGQSYDIEWTDFVNTSANGNMLTKVSGGNNWHNGGAMSKNKIPANRDGWVEFTANERVNIMVGLSTPNTSASFTSILYAAHISGGTGFSVYESGVVKTNKGGYEIGDVFRVERIGTKIYYKINGLQYAVTIDQATPELIIDAAIYSENGSVFEARSSHQVDEISPTTPSQLITCSIDESSIELTWNASTDNVEVFGYDIYLDGEFLTSTTNTNYIIEGLTPTTIYSFHIISKDGVGNTSLNSNVATVTTPAVGEQLVEIESYSETICQGDTYDFFGLQVKNQGVHFDTLQNNYGCDSLIRTLTLNFYIQDINDLSCNYRSTSYGLPNRNALSVFVDKYSDIYVGTQSGLSRSSDGGSTFQTILGGSNHYDIYVQDDSIYVGTFNGLRISTDRGNTFTSKTFNAVHSVFYVDGILYVGTRSGLLISEDNGESFISRTTSHGIGHNFISDIFVSDGIIYLATHNGLSISTDGGESFDNKQLSTSSSSRIVNGVYVSNDTIYAGSSIGLYKSTDGGESFIKKTSQKVERVFVNNSIIYIATTTGVAVSTDGGNSFNFTSIARAQDIFAIGNITYTATRYSGLGICTSVTPINRTICEGENYLFNNQLISIEGNYLDTLEDDIGCDSIIVLTLQVLPLQTSFINEFICPGGTYEFGDKFLTTPGIYIDTINSSTGCNTEVTLDLQEEHPGTIGSDQYFCNEGDPVAITETELTIGGIVNFQWQESQDSVNFTDILGAQSSTYVPLSLEQTSHFRRLVLFKSGCTDTTNIVSVFVNSTFSLVAQPDAETGKDVSIQEDGLVSPDEPYLSLVINDGYADFRSLLEFDLSAIPSEAIIESAELALYYAPSTQIINTRPTDPPSESVSIGVQFWVERITNSWDTPSVSWNNQPVTTDINRAGFSASDASFKDYEQINVTDLIGDMLADPTNSHGFLLKLEAAQSSEAVYFWSSEYLEISKRPKLSVTFSMPKPAPEIIEVEATICANETYDLNGVMVNTTGTHKDTIISDCVDSIWILDLVVLDTFFTEIDQSICEGDNFPFKGEALTIGGIYLDTLIDQNDCDSIVSLNLEVLTRPNTTISIISCEGTPYFFNEEELNTTGIYYDTLTAANGCDSILILELEVTPTANTSIARTICEGDYYPFAGNQLTNSGIYYSTLLTTSYCDSIVELNLIVVNGSSAQCQGTEPFIHYTTLDYMDSLEVMDSTIIEQRREIERNILQESKFGIIVEKTIPVIFHVLYANGEEQISEEQIQHQLDALNRDFGLAEIIDDHPNDPDSLFISSAVDTEIQFCLPIGAQGIQYHPTSITNWENDITAIKESAYGASPVSPESYLNIWVVNLPEEALGYAQMPGGDINTDGIVINYRFVGTMGAATPYGEGKVLTHLIGNYLGLYPLWGTGEECTDDYVSDTPVSNRQNIGCPIANHISTCDGFPTEMTMNFMDGTYDACKYMFTLGQKKRMHAMLSREGPRTLLSIDPTQCGGPSDQLVENEARSKDLSANSLNTQSQLTVFPNPAKDGFKIQLSELPENTIIVKVLTSDGQVMEEQVFSSGGGNHHITISTRDWLPSIYLVSIDTGQQQLFQKIAIER